MIFFSNSVIFLFYYLKVSGVPSGNKLMKTIRYPHMWRYRRFHWYQVSVSSKQPRVILESLQQSSAIFEHLREFSEILGKCSGTFVWPSEHLQKSSESTETFGKSSKTASLASLLHVSSNFMFEWEEQYLTSKRRERVRYCSCHSNIKLISSRHLVISSIYSMVPRYQDITIIYCSFTITALLRLESSNYWCNSTSLPQ